MVDGLLTPDSVGRGPMNTDMIFKGGGVLLGFGWHTERRVRGPTLGEVLKWEGRGLKNMGISVLPRGVLDGTPFNREDGSGTLL